MVDTKHGIRNRFKSRGASFSNSYKSVNVLRKVLKFIGAFDLQGYTVAPLKVQWLWVPLSVQGASKVLVRFLNGCSLETVQAKSIQFLTPFLS